ncbi:glycoside hydrolase family 32 protein [Alkalibacterium sp. MB6]|uniref:glycoside hydrolase family 32 protein n=1 Tax=Alkalibacterium sp. MB6 TaxID=2081965 RepID=UPI00137A9078|nr:glycoside hydrolase family 32 protein [Alkalibacterium sp. MB6]
MSNLTSDYWEQLAKTQIELKEKIEKDNWRLDYHLMPETGWMNDPNGLVQFNGTYHVYHQYVPDNPDGGLVHWGHKTSKDLVHFTEEEIFLSPDQTYDKDGVYSGSAFVKDDEIHFFYTGNVKHPGEHDYTFSGREQNTVHVVSKDGFTVDYREVCIPHEDYPEGFTDHIRDPKVFEKDGMYYMVLGARALNHRGKILLYKSDDLYTWTYHGIFLEGEKEMGYMWECPDFFELPQSDILILSPQGLKATEYEFENPHQAGYYLGRTDWKTHQFIPESEFKELDRGFDFYAPQTFLDESGRRLLFAWMGIGDTVPEYSNPTVPRGWQHALTMPRELTVENGLLKQRPLVEYQTLRQKEMALKESIDGQYELTVPQQETFELLVDVEKLDGDLSIHLKEDTVLTFDGNIFSLNHGVSGYGRSVRSVEVGNLERIHVFADTSSLEIFLNDGDYVITSRVYPKQLKENILIEGQTDLALSYWELKK